MPWRGGDDYVCNDRVLLVSALSLEDAALCVKVTSLAGREYVYALG